MHSQKKDKEIKKLAEELNETFFEEHIDAKIDHSNKRPGEKYFFWEMKGVPFRVEIGEKELEKKVVTLSIRDLDEKRKVKIKDLIEEIKNLGAEFDARLIAKSDEEFKSKIVSCKTKDEIKKELSSKKIAKFNFCSTQENGKICAEFIEKELQARVMGTNERNNEKPSGKCLFCGEKATAIVYAGKSY